MKRRNFNKSILQQGGLMIEALAMLGLIAVVTPTMYKKSAERTMEVEDINTAATIRTITAAANDYVSANYSTILGDMVKNGEHERRLNIDDLGAYLPYGFEIKKALYNYDSANIKLAVSRPDGSNNLTTLMLFPAKMNADNGIGQERTSRIAALIGSSGGYVTDSKKARGIGGIWKLEGDYFTKNFGNVDPHKYSIVTVSADTISASAGNEMDYSKYLQRGQDPDDTNSQWKNTMRTDLYMGGPEGPSEDVYREATGPWSIRNIKSLIVGANTSGGKDGDGNDLADAGGYGLYVAPGAANPNAYIHGSVEAGNGQLNADENNLKYGNAGTDDAGNSLFGFNVDTEGTITNLKNLNLANLWGRWNNIQIGALDDDEDEQWFVIKADADQNSADKGNLYLLGDVAEFHNRDTNDDNNNLVVLADYYNFRTDEDGNRISDIKYNTSPTFPIRMGSNTKVDGLLATGQLDTQKIRAASLSVGSQNIDDSEKWLNVDSYGITIKDVDRHHDGEDYVSTGTYGSFTNNGILLRVSDDKGDTNGITDEDRGTLGTNGGRDTSEHDIQFNLRTNKEFAGGKTLPNVAELFADNTDIRAKETARISGNGTIIQAKGAIPDWKDDYDNNSEDETQDFKDTVDSNTLLLRNDGMQMQMSSKAGSVKDKNSNDNPINISETVFSPRNNRDSAYTRTSFQKMHVDLKDSNFRIVNNLNRSVFSVRGNDNEEEKFSSNNNDVFTRNIPDLSYVKNNIANNYDVALHGNIVISPLIPNNSTGYSATNYHANVSIGTLNKNAGVNILDKRYDYYNGILSETASSGYNANQHNVVIIDQGFDENVDYNNNNKKDIVDPGTVYIRKGYVEVHGEDAANTSGYSYNDAYHGNGVLAASRLVANNPSADKTKTTVPYGHEVPQLVTNEEKIFYEDKGTNVNRYDTYMVNPAYTSVMHDIKLTTRGGARLSDILPDFINKGIYIVNNSYKELGSGNDFEISNWTDGKNRASVEDTTTVGEDSFWASPFMGLVPAPQCPPGYGRVITLAPSGFLMGTTGQLKKNETGEHYYVLPDKISEDNQIALSVNKDYKFAQISVQATNGSMDITTTGANAFSANATANNLEGFHTDPQKYVLTTSPLRKDNNEYNNLTPFTIQQSTWLKTMTKKVEVDTVGYTNKSTESNYHKKYTQGWATFMGFIYLKNMYPNELTKNAYKYSTTGSLVWNLFPVMQRSLEGYATVYCYFDRTNLFKGRDINNDYMDTLNYMSNPKNYNPPSNYEKNAEDNYKARLNDPDMKYNEVW